MAEKKLSECDQSIGAYYDVLYSFTRTTVDLNNMACDDGAEPKKLSKRFQKLIHAFMQLCMIDEDMDQCVPNKKTERKKEKVQPKKEEELPDNFIQEVDGWALCPVCRKRILKLTSETKVINLPAYCKICHAEYIISWWNIDKKNIPYHRYINKSFWIDPHMIRDEGMKGTGVNSFLNTRTSATERVAMRL